MGNITLSDMFDKQLTDCYLMSKVKKGGVNMYKNNYKTTSKPTTLCDECNKKDFQENLNNLHNDVNDMYNLKDEFVDYDGMVCDDCLKNMSM